MSWPSREVMSLRDETARASSSLVSAIRLFILSVLTEHGPMHGHQIRNQA